VLPKFYREVSLVGLAEILSTLHGVQGRFVYYVTVTRAI
jgi:hypothetical protein